MELTLEKGTEKNGEETIRVGEEKKKERVQWSEMTVQISHSFSFLRKWQLYMKVLFYSVHYIAWNLNVYIGRGRSQD